MEKLQGTGRINMGNNCEPLSVLSVLHKEDDEPVLHKEDEPEPLSILRKEDEPVLHKDELHKKDEPLSVLHNDEPLSAVQFREDRISQLPDDILVDILSKLKFKEAGQTSILSHRWLNMWMYVPHIHLVTREHPFKLPPLEQRNQAKRVFVNRVNRALELHKSSYLCEFRIVQYLDKSYQDEIDKWLEYALGMGVQRLELNLSNHGFPGIRLDDTYNFPNQLLQQTTKFGDHLALKIGFSCLREVYFSCVNISGEAIESLLLKCPLLEDLRVIGSQLLVNVVISGPFLRLKHLEINSCYRVASIKVSNTNIVFLKIHVRNKDLRLSLNNLPMLTQIWYKYDNLDKSIVSSQLSCFLSQLTLLTLEVSFPKKIMKLDKFSGLQKLRRLMLVANCCNCESLIGLTSFIESCPHLVEFAVTLIPTGEMLYGVHEKATTHSPKGLKVFEFYSYHGKYEYEDELIMFIIENAVALEKIVIDPLDPRMFDNCEIADDERSEESRKHAIEKYKNVVPKQVELVIL